MAKKTDVKKEVVEISEQVKHDVREKLITARVGLLLRAPFFGNLATRLKIVSADDWLSTAATDGRHFYFNHAFVNKLPLKQLEFLFAHEILHVAYDHIGRTGVRDKKLANIAQDYCVNADLIDQKVGDRIPSALFDEKFKGWTSEAVYDYLYENADKIDIDALTKQLCDEHLEGDCEGEGEEGEGEGAGKAGGGRPRLSKEEQDKIKEEFRDAMLAAVSACGGVGNLPGGIRRRVTDLVAPVISWKELIQQQIQSTQKSDYSWSRPSRRNQNNGIFFPGMKYGESIDVVIGIDTSGSITEADLRIFLSEIQGIMETYTEYKITVAGWDTMVHNSAVFTSENLENIVDFVPGGGGGTDPKCMWDWLNESGIVPKKLIMFTDYCFSSNWGAKEVETYCDTVWIIRGNQEATAEFGVFAIYEKLAGE